MLGYVQDNLVTYDQLALDYDRHFNERFLSSVKNSLSPFLSKLAPHSSILEIGCGAGLCTCALQPHKVTALDFSSAMIKTAKAHCPEARYIQGDVLSYEFKRRFDGCLLFALIHLFKKCDALAILDKVKKLAPLLFVNTTIHDAYHAGVDSQQEYVEHKLPRYRVRHTKASFLNLIAEAGLEVIYTNEDTDPLGRKWASLICHG